MKQKWTKIDKTYPTNLSHPCACSLMVTQFLWVIFCVFLFQRFAATNREPGEQKNQVGVNMTFKASICIGIQFLGFLFWVAVFSRSWTGSRLVNLDFVRHKMAWFRAHLKNVHLDVCRVLHTSVLEGNAAMPFKTWAAHMFIFSLVCQGDWVISLTN